MTHTSTLTARVWTAVQQGHSLQACGPRELLAFTSTLDLMEGWCKRFLAQTESKRDSVRSPDDHDYTAPREGAQRLLEWIGERGTILLEEGSSIKKRLMKIKDEMFDKDFRASIIDLQKKTRLFLCTAQERTVFMDLFSQGLSTDLLKSVGKGASQVHAEWARLPEITLTSQGHFFCFQPTSWTCDRFVALQNAGLTPEESYFLYLTYRQHARPGLYHGAVLYEVLNSLECLTDIATISIKEEFSDWLHAQPASLQNELEELCEVGMKSSDVENAFLRMQALCNTSLSPSETFAAKTHHLSPNASLEDWNSVAQALEDTGLIGMTWSSHMPVTPSTLKEVTEGVLAANTSLCQVTQWEGAVLGLNGFVRLELQKEELCAGAYATSAGFHSGCITLSPQGGWKYLGHEWCHAFDNFLSKENATCARTHDLLSEYVAERSPTQKDALKINTPSDPVASALLHLLEGFQSVTQEVTYEDHVIKLRATYLERLAERAPDAAEALCQHPKAPWEMPPEKLESLLKNSSLNDKPAPLVFFLTEARLLGTLCPPTEHASFWHAFTAEWKTQAQQRTEIHDYINYFEDPSEIMAYGFEVLSTNTGFEPAGYMHPFTPTQQAPEHAREAFSTFFSKITPSVIARAPGIIPHHPPVNTPTLSSALPRHLSQALCKKAPTRVSKKETPALPSTLAARPRIN